MQVSSYLKLSILVALTTIGLKTGAWWLTGSVGLLSDALESLVNLAGATFALAMVTLAAQPPDDEHPYGHHKAEYFSSGFEGVLILVAAVAILWAALDRFLHPQALTALGPGLALSVVSSILNAVLAAAMLRKAREHRSMALEADARHLVTDVWTSAGVITGLIGVHYTRLAVARSAAGSRRRGQYPARGGVTDPALVRRTDGPCGRGPCPGADRKRARRLPPSGDPL